MGVNPNIFDPSGNNQWVKPVSQPEFSQPEVTTQCMRAG
jgi:hypothetical protein